MFPDVHGDNRGNFTEIFRDKMICGPRWLSNLDWVKQINRSESVAGVFRGMHAQSGKSCQSKLVECVSGDIVDVILDARPQSKTFGKRMAFELSPKLKNRLFVPKGFLHGFFVRPSDVDVAIFQYFIGGCVYDKKSEITVNPRDVIGSLDDMPDIDVSSLALSEKDMNGIELKTFLDDIQTDFLKKNIYWYK